MARGDWEERLEEMDGFYEITAANDHDEVDGIEVGFAAEATSEIGARIDSRTELLADRTQECQLAVALFVRPTEAFEQTRHVDVIAQGVK